MAPRDGINQAGGLMAQRLAEEDLETLKGLRADSPAGHERLQTYMRMHGVDIDPATTAWCAAMVNSVLSAEGLRGSGGNKKWAPDFARWGQGVDPNSAQKGDVMLYNSGHHVGMFTGNRGADGSYEMIAGNERMPGESAPLPGRDQWGGVGTHFMRADQVQFRRALDEGGDPSIAGQRGRSQGDRVALARTIEGEAGGEGLVGMQAVGAVIANRARRNFSGFGTDPNSQASAHGQFQGEARPSAQALSVADSVLSGSNPDPTGGALYYANPAASSRQWARNLNPSNSYQIGRHFFTDNAQGRPFHPGVMGAEIGRGGLGPGSGGRGAPARMPAVSVPGVARFASRLRHQVKFAAQQQIGEHRPVVYGHVATYDPETHRARAIIPSFTNGSGGHVLSGWFPLGTSFAANGFGFQYHPIGGATMESPTQGEQVMLTFSERFFGVIASAHMIFSKVNQPPNKQMQPGEFHVQSKPGAYISYKQNGDTHFHTTAENDGPANAFHDSTADHTITTGRDHTQSVGRNHQLTAANDTSRTAMGGSISDVTQGSNGSISHVTQRENSPITSTTQRENSPVTVTTAGQNSGITISASGLNSALTLASATGLALVAPEGQLALPAAGVQAAAMAAGAAASNIGALSGDLSGALPNPDVVGCRHIADADALPRFASNAAAISGGVPVGGLYSNGTIASGELVLCVAH